MSRGVGERRRAREYALQLLFQLDLAPQGTDEAVSEFWNGKRVADAVRLFAEHIVSGTMARRDAIDAMLASCAHHWRISRMAAVDRNILRLAVYEFLCEPDTPRIVVIDEAIEIAKKFGNDESGPFINGILDALRLKLESGEMEVPPEIAEPSPAALLPVRKTL
ncbi:MAG TPA: transcription antitermination factor NusB [Candidatus Polarisedimenticolia bacterium]